MAGSTRSAPYSHRYSVLGHIKNDFEAGTECWRSLLTPGQIRRHLDDFASRLHHIEYRNAWLTAFASK